MRFARLVLRSVGVVAVSFGSLATPPDDSVERWATAVGGRDRVARIHSIYREATIQVAGGEGTIRAWHTADGRYRKEERGGNFARVETFDGTRALMQIGAAPARELTGEDRERAVAQAFANTNAIFFAFFPDRRHGDVVVEADGTIVLKPDGGIDWRVALDPVTSLPSRMTHAEGARSVVVDFVSYEIVDGLKVESELRRSPGDPRFDAVIRFTKTELNPAIDESLFSIASPQTSTGAPPPRLAGHWEGAIHSPLEDVAVSVDLAADEAGKLGGTFSSASQRLNGFPLSSASVDGEAVKIEIKTADPGVRTFDGRLSEDGATIKGQFLVGVYAVPFTLQRDGDARIAPPPVSAAIDANLAGSWTGALSIGAQSLPVKLTLMNRADRTATGTWAAGAGPNVPVAIASHGGTLTLTSPVTPATFTGSLSADGTQIVGMLNEVEASRPVVFRRAAINQ